MVFCSIRGSQHQTIMLRNIHQDSLLNAFFLSILATAGLFYVNLGGSFLSAFVDGLSIERDAAGFIVSANKYGAAFGGLLAGRPQKKKLSGFMFQPLITERQGCSNRVSSLTFLRISVAGPNVGTIGFTEASQSLWAPLWAASRVGMHPQSETGSSRPVSFKTSILRI